MSQDGSGRLLENIMEHTIEKVNDEIHYVDGKTTVVRDQCYDIPEGSNTSLFELSSDFASPKSTKSALSAGLQEHDHVFKSGGMIMQFVSHEEQGVMPRKNDGPCTSTCPTSVKVKDEPWDNSSLNNVNKDAIRIISNELPNVKNEWDVHNEFHDDQVEHVCLIDRLNFLMYGEDSSLNIATTYSSSKNTRPSSFISSSIVSDSAENLGIKRPRKRKKTATYYLILRCVMQYYIYFHTSIIIFIQMLNCFAVIQFKQHSTRMLLGSCRYIF